MMKAIENLEISILPNSLTGKNLAEKIDFTVACRWALDQRLSVPDAFVVQLMPHQAHNPNYLIETSKIELSEAYNELGKSIFDEAWTGQERELSQRLHYTLKNAFLRHIRKKGTTVKNLKFWTCGSRDSDENLLIFLFTEGNRLIQDEPLKRLRPEDEEFLRNTIPIRYRYNEHQVFEDCAINRDAPELVKGIIQAYKRLFYIGDMLRNLVLNGHIKVYHFNQKSGEYTKGESKDWGRPTFVMCAFTNHTAENLASLSLDILTVFDRKDFKLFLSRIKQQCVKQNNISIAQAKADLQKCMAANPQWIKKQFEQEILRIYPGLRPKRFAKDVWKPVAKGTLFEKQGRRKNSSSS
jgi:hypothetical protein